MYLNYFATDIFHRSAVCESDACRVSKTMIADVFKWKFDANELWSLLANRDEIFPHIRGRKFIHEHFGLFVQMTIAYVIVIFSIKRCMRDREPFKLTNALRFWNFFLSVFSIYGSWAMFPFMVEQIRRFGLYGCGCEALSTLPSQAEYWLFLTVLSKALEFVDTFFLVLRKKPLIFLHWYHHVATFLFFCVTYPTPSSQIRVGAIVNLFVHAFMYPYYFIRSMNIKLPAKISMAVTVLQLTQFVCFIYGCTLMYYSLATNQYTCDTPMFALNSTFGLSLSYFVLFANFFHKSYLQRGGKEKYRSEKKVN
ncbi:Protein CBR-ELO-7 [Caenorhabditis briggsae]|uniref:Very-long-chain 3-oxoacyl-CoA synthase n=3 Tax=Caenorhabditis briggsae TaxID=6238 RepID=A0AAE9ADN3_CAEBR|nr:Protein CBR-ELO-7 [Caenorhabditis briggsae]ULT94225.1 hypothetical protein L3Y34_003597 [Caenorhabditis briggsae]CAP37155.1 Protein CBR-ELO-7 [Caenorhabditis briggsae]